MDIFLSWSGEASRQIAAVLLDWLPSVLQSTHPYMSSETIDKGQRWSVDIATKLHEAQFGLICVTPENVDAPWVMFESGALSKSLQTARVAPLIFGLKPTDLSGSPLLQFQMTEFSKDDVKRLLVSMNNAAPEKERVASEVVEKAFARAWSELASAINAIDLGGRNKPTVSSGVAVGSTSATDEAIQEILSITRSQLKLLSSPEDLLPRAYLRDAIDRSSKTGRDIGADHPVWNDLEEGLASIRFLIDDMEIGQSLATGRSMWKSYEQIKMAVDFLINTLAPGRRRLVNRLSSGRVRTGIEAAKEES